MRTFAPACHWVPRCRTMIFPASTCSPPKRLTPRRFDSESRPFFELPPAFLCAMTYSSGAADRSDFDFGEQLPMPLLALVVLAAAEFDDADLVALALGDDLGLDF